jgi:two-component system, OmpR family, alkaline phosphatase synthesis response regulator PhoP
MQRKILIVDDEPHLRSLIQQALEDLEDDGVELFTACDGEEALKTIEAEKPDLIFLDVMMPKKSGYDVCQTVKNSPLTKSIYVILLTAKGQQVDRKRGDEAGADLFITKPFKAQALLDKAREVLKM